MHFGGGSSARRLSFVLSLLLLPAFGAVPTGAGSSSFTGRREVEEALEAAPGAVEAAKAPEPASAPAQEEEPGEPAPAAESAPVSREAVSTSAAPAAPAPVRGSRSGSQRPRNSPTLPFALAAVALLLALAGTAQALTPDFDYCPGKPANPTGIEDRRVLLASSPDGLNFTRNNTILADRASVPDAVVLNSGRVLVYFVVGCKKINGTEQSVVGSQIGVAVSDDNGTSWVLKNVTFNGTPPNGTPPADPNVVLLPNGSLRLFATIDPDTAGSLKANTYSFNSTDGFNYTFEGERVNGTSVFNNDSAYNQGVLDPETYRFSDTDWRLWNGGRAGFNRFSTSTDGNNFTDKGYFCPGNETIGGGGQCFTVGDISSTSNSSFARMYVFGRVGGISYIRSLNNSSNDTGNWTNESGNRLVLDTTTGLESDQLAAPTVVRMATGTYLMAYEVTIPPSNITSFANNVTNSNATSLNATLNASVLFNATANQTGNWTWFYNGTLVKTDNLANASNLTQLFNQTGSFQVRVNFTNTSAGTGWNDTVVWSVTVAPPAPAIVSRSNNVTNNASLSITINVNQTVFFNATADQAGQWTWRKNGTLQKFDNVSNTTNNFTVNFTTAGAQNVSVNVSNANGTSSTLLWNVTVNAPPVPEPYAVFGRVFNETGSNDTNGTDVSVIVVNQTTLNGTCTRNTVTAADGSYTVDLDGCGLGNYSRGDKLTVRATNQSRGAYGENETRNISTNLNVSSTEVNITWRLEPLWRNATSNKTAVGFDESIRLSAEGVDGRNLTRAVLFTNESGGFAPSGSIRGAGGNFTTHLSGADDPSDWLGSQNIQALARDPINGTIYIGATGGRFGVYYPANATAVDLNATDVGDWLGTQTVNALAFDPSSGRLFLGGVNGTLGAYYLSNNTTVNLSGTDTADWLGLSTIRSLAVNSTGAVFIAAESGKFGVYYPSNNTTVDLSATDAGNWIGTDNILALAVNSTGHVYLGVALGKFGVYNPATNVGTDLSTTDAGNWIGTDNILALANDSAGRIYLSADSGKFGRYDSSTNVLTDLSATDTGDFLGSSSIFALAYDPASTLVYLGADSGKFGAYSTVTNVVTNLSGADPGDWLGSNAVRALVSDPAEHFIYLGGDTLAANPRFGVYNRTSEFNFALPNSGTWLEANFTWRNGDIPGGTYIGWWIHLLDDEKRANNTSLRSFRVVPSLTNWSNNVTNNTNLTFTVEIPKVVRFAINASGNVDWNWFRNGVLVKNSTTNSNNDTFDAVFNVTGVFNISAFGANTAVGDTEMKTWFVTAQDTTPPVTFNNTATVSPIEVVKPGNVTFQVSISDPGNVTSTTFRVDGVANLSQGNYSANLSASLVAGDSKNGTWEVQLPTGALATGFYNWTSVNATDFTGNVATTNITKQFRVVAAVNITLFPTRSLIALPVDRALIDSNPTAEQLCGGTPLQHLARFEGGSQTFSSHICGLLANNYNIELLRGYWSKAPGADPVNGTNVTKQGFDLPSLGRQLETGWNLVAVRNSSNSAAGVCGSIGPNAAAVARLNTTSNSYETHICGLGANNFTTAVGRGYWVYVNAPVFWNQ